MHVVIIPSWYSSDENVILGSFFKEQAKALKESGIEVTICYNEIFPMYKYKKINTIFKKKINFKIEDGIETYRYLGFNYLFRSKKRFKLFSKRLEKLINVVIKNKGNVDLFHFHSCFWAGISGPYLKKKFNVPYVLTEHTGMNYSKRISNSYYEYIKESFINAEKLISVSRSLEKEMRYICDRDIEVIHNFIDGEVFKPSNLDFSNSKIKFLSIAFLVDGKGFENLLFSFKELILRGYKAELFIGGEGYLRNKLERFCIENELTKHVKFLGLLSREDVVKYMNECDVFVLPSEYETFGVVYIEAMALGKPIIATKNGGAEDILLSEDVGILIKNNSLKDLIIGMEYMINNLSFYKKSKIREYFLDNFERNKIIEKLKDVYKNCLNTQGLI